MKREEIMKFLETVNVFAETGDCEKCPANGGISGPIFPCGKFTCAAVAARREQLGEEKIREMAAERAAALEKLEQKTEVISI